VSPSCHATPVIVGLAFLAGGTGCHLVAGLDDLARGAGGTGPGTTSTSDTGGGGGETVTVVPHWWLRDSCGAYHSSYHVENDAASEDDDRCYLLTNESSDPASAASWSAPIEIPTRCTAVSMVTDPIDCTVHLSWRERDYVPPPPPAEHNPGPLHYAVLAGGAVTLADPSPCFEGPSYPSCIAYRVYGEHIVLGQDIAPHVFWSFSEGYHRRRKSDGTWTDPLELTKGKGGGWGLTGAIDDQNRWRVFYHTASQDLTPDVQIKVGTSEDDGDTWSPGTNLFQDIADAQHFTRDHRLFTTHGSEYWALVFRTNHSGEDGWWYADFARDKLASRGLWAPLGAGTPIAPLMIGTSDTDHSVYPRYGVLDPAQPHTGVVLFFERVRGSNDEPIEAYYQPRCVGGKAGKHRPWPLQSPQANWLRIVVTWATDEQPRAFWQELGGPEYDLVGPAEGWYAMTLDVEPCD
jgi:hypothetical protein